MLPAALAVAVAFAVIHLVAGRMRFLARIPRSRWLSFAGGVSVAYVLVHLLPELGEAQEAVQKDARGLLPFLEDHAYLVALLGLGLFYGVERSSHRSRAQGASAGSDRTGPAAFWLSIATFAALNAVIGYLLLHRTDDDLRGLVLFGVALGLHFVINDFGLREHHKQRYDAAGRWVLAAAVVGGWAIGAAWEIPVAAIGLLQAFIGGGVILNTIKEELPAERESRFGPFALGAAGYAALLQLV